jgi:hypothetical protein
MLFANLDDRKNSTTLKDKETNGITRKDYCRIART